MEADLILTPAAHPESIASPAAVLMALRRALPYLSAEAGARDIDGCFPTQGVAQLADIGMLSAPLPRALGGFGMGTEPAGAPMLATALRLVGRGNLSLGRLYEGHVNALRLIMRHGSDAVKKRTALDAQLGCLFGVWNTDDPLDPLRQQEDRLQGRKIYCSGAGAVARAMVTAAPGQMLLVSLEPGQGADLSSWRAQGMRGSTSGTMDFTGLSGERIGRPGDYQQRPDFSGGAWRFLAVQCGGVEAVLEGMRNHLVHSGRVEDGQQAARLGQAAIMTESARLWVEEAAIRAEDLAAGADAVAYVNLARLAVEQAALEVIQLAQRSVGLASFMTGHPLERICRDLATYLRQPGPDNALRAGAAYMRDLPVDAGDAWA